MEPVFVAAGGQALDHAGSREIARRFESAWPSGERSLLILLLAPGAGDELWLSTAEPTLPVSSQTQELVRDAARSLWIPSKVVHEFTPLRFWPIVGWGPVVALMGSDPRAYSGGSVDPRALHRAAQLATEIALRWAKRRQRELEATATRAT
jgi:hypothetical protein